MKSKLGRIAKLRTITIYESNNATVRRKAETMSYACRSIDSSLSSGIYAARIRLKLALMLSSYAIGLCCITENTFHL